MKAYEQIESLLDDDIIKDMQLDVARWIDRNKLHREFNIFWSHYEEYNPNYNSGYVLIDFAIHFMQKLVLIKEEGR